MVKIQILWRRIYDYLGSVQHSKINQTARCERERYRQRDEIQHRVIPLLPADDRDKFERAMNRHFRL